MKIHWTSKWAIAGLLLFIIFLAQQKFRQFRLQSNIESEKARLQKQLNELEGKNSELEQTLSYLDSETYKELIAKQQMNMQKDGELAYGFSEEAHMQTASAENTQDANQSNYKKWVDYFLNKKTHRE